MLIPCIVYWKFYDMQAHFQIFFWLFSDWLRKNKTKQNTQKKTTKKQTKKQKTKKKKKHHALTDNVLKGYIACIFEIKTTPDIM